MRQRSDGADDARDGQELIKCLLCMGRVEKTELLDHIAGEDLNYAPHRCDSCGLKCFNVEKAVKHAEQTRHPVTLNKGSFNEYAETVITRAYSDSVSAHDTEKRGREEVVHVRQARPAFTIPAMTLPPMMTIPPPAIPVVRFQDETVRWSPVQGSPQSILPAAVERCKRERTPVEPESERAKKRKVLTEPKRAMNAWMYFLHDFKERLTEEARDAGLNFLVHAKTVWDAVEDKSKWERLAADDKERYCREKGDGMRTGGDDI